MHSLLRLGSGAWSGIPDIIYSVLAWQRPEAAKPVFPVDKQNGAYYSFNNLWENVFQKRPEDDPDKLEKVVSNGHGKHGLILAHAWATHYGSVVRPDERGLVQLRVQNLLRLIDET
ncbi:hypothetical protein C8F04DRAFT_1268083 [Mycena alexandri]|uniref:Uncharacterized protein n=1 Tax=Mycena alexandri TaxID=1745969 RepID=A0AAD6SEF2_9AGAR|nr:hypothetical protein C8F04DRAFT_1268083 [Mycena alexandri]